MSDTDTPALVVCERLGSYRGAAHSLNSHEDNPNGIGANCLNPRPAATIELPASSAPQIEGKAERMARLVEKHDGCATCGAPRPCAAHPAPPEGTQGT